MWYLLCKLLHKPSQILQLLLGRGESYGGIPLRWAVSAGCNGVSDSQALIARAGIIVMDPVSPACCLMCYALAENEPDKLGISGRGLNIILGRSAVLVSCCRECLTQGECFLWSLSLCCTLCWQGPINTELLPPAWLAKPLQIRAFLQVPWGKVMLPSVCGVSVSDWPGRGRTAVFVSSTDETSV